MPASHSGSIQIGGGAEDSILVTGSQNVIVQAGQVMIQAAKQARAQERDPARMLRVMAVLAAPVLDPRQPERTPVPLDLRQEWHRLADGVRRSSAPILLARLTPPTLDALRAALSPGAQAQHVLPHILHFSGHAWSGGLLLEDELGQVHRANTDEILDALKGIPRPPDLVVLNACESAADARSVAQALVDGGLARAAVGHTRPVYDPEAVAFAATLYADLTNGYPLKDAVERASSHVTTHEVLLLGDSDLRFERFTGGDPWIDDRRPTGNLHERNDLFLGRGQELVEIARVLAHPPAAVILSGAAGIGKTTLMVEAAHRNAWRFPGSVAWAAGPRPGEARPASAADLLTALADGLGLDPPPGRVAEELCQRTAAQPTLLLLDNLEGLPTAELTRLRDLLHNLGAESAALLTLRPPYPALDGLPTARPLPLHYGLARDAAVRYVMSLASRWHVPLQQGEAARLAAAAAGHPLLIEKLVAQARQRDLDDLLDEVEARRGDFAAQVEAVYAWSADRLAEQGRLAAWAALLLFPAGSAPDGPLRAAVDREGLDALRGAALADFDPAAQLWRWHATMAEYAHAHWPPSEEERRVRLAATMAEYAHAHWPPSEEERRVRLAATLPAWTRWLKRLEPETAETAARLEGQLANLEALLDAIPALAYDRARGWFQALHRAFPPPDRTLALRDFEAAVYRAWADAARQASAAEDQATALNMTGYALSSLGRREEALAATQEGADLYRKLAQANPQAFLPDLALSLNNLGNMLSGLGRREEALTRTQEAADLYQKLAQANPQAFLPDLAMSLGMHGSVLRDMGRHAEAAAAFAEGLRLIAPLFRALPQAFTGLTNALLENYLRSCADADQEADADLVAAFR